MNYLPGAKLIARLPITKPRHDLIKWMLIGNTALFGFYLLAPGPHRLVYKNNLGVTSRWSPMSIFTAHFCHTEWLPFIFNSAVLYTLGNYHVKQYGIKRFAVVYGAACIVGGLMTVDGCVWDNK